MSYTEIIVLYWVLIFVISTLLYTISRKLEDASCIFLIISGLIGFVLMFYLGNH